LFASVERLVDQWFDRLVELRRDLHRHPELAWHEEQTTARIKQFLAESGIDSRSGPRKRGLLVDIATSKQISSRFAVRGDIDAIPVTEQTNLPYASLNEGVMHACGHDIHATVLAGTLVVVNELVEQGDLEFPVGFRGIFQPAEEVAQGAAEMVQAGALENVQAILAMHVDPMRNVGTVGLRYGVQGAACDQINVTVKGVGGHGARPHEACDPIFAAASWLNEVYSRLPRSIDSREPIAFSICEIKGGSTVNVIPQQANMRGTLRTLSNKSRDKCLEVIDQISKSVALMTGTQIEITRGVSVPFVDNHPQIVQLVADVTESYLQKDAVEWIAPSMGSEDFAYFMKDVPATLIRIGSTTAGQACHPLHSAELEVDESVIRIGCNIMVRSTLQWWKDHGEK